MQIYTSCLLVRLLLSACTFDFQFCSILCSRLQSASFSCPGRCQTSLNVHELAPLSRRVSTSANGCANARACSCLAWFLLHNLKTTVAAQINLETCMHKELLHGFRRSQSEVPSIMSQISVRNADHIFTMPCSFIVFGRFWPGGQLLILSMSHITRTDSKSRPRPPKGILPGMQQKESQSSKQLCNYESQ